VGLDGSEASEVTLPFVRSFLRRGAHVTVAAIPDGGAEESKLPRYAETITSSMGKGVLDLVTTGSGPARTLVRLAEERDADLVVVASHGRGGIERVAHVELGSVPTRLIEDLERPVLVVPSREPRPGAPTARPRDEV
jgi:nucleotide-binding universal stress UspA family protein